MDPNTASPPGATANGSARRQAAGRQWPWPVRVLIIVLMIATVIAVWATTARSQR
jgi:hypothetical protein